MLKENKWTPGCCPCCGQSDPPVNQSLEIIEDDRLDKIIELLESISKNISRIDNKYVRNG